MTQKKPDRAYLRFLLCHSNISYKGFMPQRWVVQTVEWTTGMHHCTELFSFFGQVYVFIFRRSL